MGHPQRVRVVILAALAAVAVACGDGAGNFPPSSILGLFTHLGLADSAMHPKTALSAWDAVRARPYLPP